MTDAATPADDATRWVICLCAEWCHVCRSWRETFDAAAREHPDLRFAWVDVEDEDEAMGDVDIQTFPTLLLAQGDHAVFMAPVVPMAAHLSRTLGLLTHAATDEASSGPSVSAQAQALLGRLKAGVLPKR
jgi:thiol-disulfide isomerase/thioredoxin